jgi:hypothetical protein
MNIVHCHESDIFHAGVQALYDMGVVSTKEPFGLSLCHHDISYIKHTRFHRIVLHCYLPVQLQVLYDLGDVSTKEPFDYLLPRCRAPACKPTSHAFDTHDLLQNKPVLSHFSLLVLCCPQVLYDLGVVSTKEPFGRLVSQGMILGEVEFSYCVDGEGRTCSEDKHDAVTVRVSETASQSVMWHACLV